MTPAPSPILARQQRLAVRRCGITVARQAVARLHRHHRAPPGGLVAFEVLDEARWPRGWAIVGRPVSRVLDGAGWVEVTRSATDGTPNACSALYGACERWAWREGVPLLTYTREDEAGASLRGAGWVQVGLTDGGGKARRWSCPSRPRPSSHNEEVRKRRWIPGNLYRALVEALAAALVVRP